MDNHGLRIDHRASFESPFGDDGIWGTVGGAVLGGDVAKVGGIFGQCLSVAGGQDQPALAQGCPVKGEQVHAAVCIECATGGAHIHAARYPQKVSLHRLSRLGIVYEVNALESFDDQDPSVLLPDLASLFDRPGWQQRDRRLQFGTSHQHRFVLRLRRPKTRGRAA